MPPFKVHYVHALQHDVIESIMFPHSKIVTVILATTLTLGDWLHRGINNSAKSGFETPTLMNFRFSQDVK